MANPQELCRGTTTLNWMATLPNDLLLSEMSIPGTHDSATAVGVEQDFLNNTSMADLANKFASLFTDGLGHDLAETVANAILNIPLFNTLTKDKIQLYVKTQSKTIDDQLREGIRFFDMRVRSDDAGVENMRMYHGQYPLGIKFNDALHAIADFLKANPSETVLVSINDEGTGVGVHNSYVKYCKVKFLNFLDGNQLYTLGEARGHMVLFRRFDSPAGQEVGFNCRDYGSGWHDAVYLPAPGHPKYHVQDESGLAINDKIKQVVDHLNDAKHNNSMDILYFTICATSPVWAAYDDIDIGIITIKNPLVDVLPSPETVSERLNDHLWSDVLEKRAVELTPYARRGIVAMDYYWMKNVIALIKTNFQFGHYPPLLPRFTRNGFSACSVYLKCAARGEAPYLSCGGDDGHPVMTNSNAGRDTWWYFAATSDGMVQIRSVYREIDKRDKQIPANLQFLDPSVASFESWKNNSPSQNWIIDGANCPPGSFHLINAQFSGGPNKFLDTNNSSGPIYLSIFGDTSNHMTQWTWEFAG